MGTHISRKIWKSTGVGSPTKRNGKNISHKLHFLAFARTNKTVKEKRRKYFCIHFLTAFDVINYQTNSTQINPFRLFGFDSLSIVYRRIRAGWMNSNLNDTFYAGLHTAKPNKISFGVRADGLELTSSFRSVVAMITFQATISYSSYLFERLTMITYADTFPSFFLL